MEPIQRLTAAERCSEKYTQDEEIYLDSLPHQSSQSKTKTNSNHEQEHHPNKSRSMNLNLEVKEINSSSSSPDEALSLNLNLDFSTQCSVHSNIDPKLHKSQFVSNSSRKGSVGDNNNTSSLAKTAVAVRAVSKKLGRRRVKWFDLRTILVVTKPKDKSLSVKARQLVLWLLSSINSERETEGGVTVYVDLHLKKSKRFSYTTILTSLPPSSPSQLKFWSPTLISSNPDLFDFVITLGGDGTVLYTSWLFQKVVPAIIPFHLGSLGFLTTFDFHNHQKLISDALAEGVRINMRMRFACTIYRYRGENPNRLKKKDHGSLLFDPQFSACMEEEEEEEEVGSEAVGPEGKENLRPEGCHKFGKQLFVAEATYQILNDLVVDRGPSPFMSQLELYGDGEYLTTVQADGLAVATPTGSTAYSLAAGGSLVHPDVPALLITPICPHSLSFRPMLLPDSTVLFICLPFTARGTAFASFDGRARVELRRGDFILVEASKFPFPTVCASGSQSKDWFKSLNRCLLWNQRTLQKKLESESELDDDDEEMDLDFNGNGESVG